MIVNTNITHLNDPSYRKIILNFFFIWIILVTASCKKKAEPIVDDRPTISVGKWSILDIPNSPRYDDIFFINKNVGWVAGGNSGTILKTINSGKSWTSQLNSSKYLRSIEFFDENVGFCGSIDSALYRTNDGGKSWIDISMKIPLLPGICGLSVADNQTIFGCGIWSSPAFIVKSENRGETWEKLDMSNYATALIDMYFFNKNDGIVVGKANPSHEGGIILSTNDGGKHWKVIYKTGVPNDYIWKIQTPDKKNFFASIQSEVGNTRILKSNDAGKSWETIVISEKYHYLQSVGFIDSLKGWAGGNSSLFETENGGSSWKQISLGTAYNRFFRIDQKTAFLSGRSIYKFTR